MSKYVTALLAVLSLAIVPVVTARAAPADRSARAAVLYPIPAGPGSTGANAVGPAAAYLVKFSPSALAATGGPKLRARTSGPGTFTFVLSAATGGTTLTIGTGSKTVGRAGAITVKIVFTRAGEAALMSAKGKLRLMVTAIFKPKHGRTTTAKRIVTLK